jgi:hypothetical protein
MMIVNPPTVFTASSNVVSPERISLSSFSSLAVVRLVMSKQLVIMSPFLIPLLYHKTSAFALFTSPRGHDSERHSS